MGGGVGGSEVLQVVRVWRVRAAEVLRRHGHSGRVSNMLMGRPGLVFLGGHRVLGGYGV